jgi:hypothetical protein
MSGEHRLDLPHTLTCYRCHFEPLLEVEHSADREPGATVLLEHQLDDCIGLWESLWLADERFLYCPLCHAGAPATAAVIEKAEAENEAARTLIRLSIEGRPLI